MRTSCADCLAAEGRRVPVTSTYSDGSGFDSTPPSAARASTWPSVRATTKPMRTRRMASSSTSTTGLTQALLASIPPPWGPYCAPPRFVIIVTGNLARRSWLRHSDFPLGLRPGRQCLVDGAEQLPFAEGLQENGPALAPFRRLPALEQLEAAGDQDDGQLGAGSARQPLEVEAVDRRHADVRDEAIDLAEGRVLEQRLRGLEQMHPVSGRLQQVLERFEHPGIVIDHGDDGFAHGPHRGMPLRRCAGGMETPSLAARRTSSATEPASILRIALLR